MANDAVTGSTLRTATIRPVGPVVASTGSDRQSALAPTADPTRHRRTGEPTQTGCPRRTEQDNLTGRIEQMLTGFLSTEVAAMEAIDPAAGAFARLARDCVLTGGKRLRPVFAYWGWRGVVGAGQPVEPVLPALAALEVLHTFALVHDDVMDTSATRRGRPTAHRTLAAEHATTGRRGDPDRFGEAGAILIGDLCAIWADRLLGQAALPAGVLLEVRRGYDQMRVETVAGQYLDVFGESDVANWSVERALRVARYKTAGYTVQRPLLLGAALAGPGRRVRVTAAYRRYGLAVGEAFQLCDDLLGAYGDPETTGKPAGDDLLSGKPTVLFMLARQLASPRQRAVLDRIVADGPRPTALPAGNRAAITIELAEVIAATGAVDRVRDMIDQRVAEALAALRGVPIDEGARTALTGLAEKATRRRA